GGPDRVRRDVARHEVRDHDTGGARGRHDTVAAALDGDPGQADADRAAFDPDGGARVLDLNAAEQHVLAADPDAGHPGPLDRGVAQLEPVGALLHHDPAPAAGGPDVVEQDLLRAHVDVHARRLLGGAEVG